MKDRLKFKAAGTIHNTDTVGTTMDGPLDLSTSALTSSNLIPG